MKESYIKALEKRNLIIERLEAMAQVFNMRIAVEWALNEDGNGFSEEMSRERQCYSLLCEKATLYLPDGRGVELGKLDISEEMAGLTLKSWAVIQTLPEGWEAMVAEACDSLGYKIHEFGNIPTCVEVLPGRAGIPRTSFFIKSGSSWMEELERYVQDAQHRIAEAVRVFQSGGDLEEVVDFSRGANEWLWGDYEEVCPKMYRV